MKNYNVQLDVSTDLNNIISELESVGVVINSTFSSLSILNVSCSEEALLNISGVMSIEEDTEILLKEQSEWHLNRLCSTGLPMRNIYIAMNQGEGAVAYLLDTGINSNHIEFSDAIAENRIVNLYSHTGEFSDNSGHGTGLASLIIGKTLGVTPKSTLKIVKIPVGNISISSLLAVFDAVLNDHLNTSSQVKVVNCSWTIPRSNILDAKISQLQTQGLVVVAAAGNEISDANNYSPVGLDTVLGVAASDAYDRVISWAPNIGSNWGPDVDITAPGIDVLAADLSGSYSEASGTSIAAAILSGVVLQYITENPSYDAADIQTLLLGEAKADLLFRNESIYGTTPNKLVYLTQKQQLLFEAIPRIQSGDTATFAFTTRDSFDSVIPVSNLSDISQGCSWATCNKISENSYEITLTPTFTNPGRYLLHLLLYKGQEFLTNTAIFKVYINDPSELDTSVVFYFENPQGILTEYIANSGPEDGTTLTLASPTCLVTGNECPKNSFCCGATGSNCCFCAETCDFGCGSYDCTY